MIINRHGDFDPEETARLLRPDGLFITEQVGGENDRDLVEMVLPDVPKPFPELEPSIQKKKFEDAGLKIIRAEEAFRPIFHKQISCHETDRNICGGAMLPVIAVLKPGSYSGNRSYLRYFKILLENNF